MINISNPAECCGCGACAQICPKNCITMAPDGEGFLYPAVDMDQCVRCGLCVKACPMTAKPAQAASVAAYGAYARDEKTRQESSSGGIFPLAARWVLEQGGVVFGAAFDEDFSVCHKMIDSLEQLPLLQGSKYVQSRMEDAYRRAKQALDAGKTVLFSGVACQIAGLKAYLGGEYENLYTLDVLCHGVPSPKVWRHYLEQQIRAYGGAVTAVAFRNKETGWRHYSVAIDFAGGEKYARKNSEDAYMRCFLGDSCLRPSCHSCRFKDIPRQSDLTLGDAWGIGGIMPELDDDRGTSVVIVNSPKGQALWQALEPWLIAQGGQLDALLPPTADSRKSVQMHPRRDRFFAALEAGADMSRLAKLSQRTLLRRALSYGKRTLKRFF